jgi:hypothetical protein
MYVSRKTALLLLAALMASMLATSCSTQHRYASYEDCLLENLKGSETEAGVLTVREACRAKFPPSMKEQASEQAAAEEAAAAALKASREAEAAVAPLIKEQQESDAAAKAAAESAAAAAEAYDKAVGG